MPPTNPVDPTAANPSRPRRSLLGSALLVLLAAVVVIIGGRSVASSWFYRVVENRLSRGVLHEAQRWHGRADHFSPNSSESQLLRARLMRQLGSRDEWETTMDSLDPAVAERQQRLERRLGAIRWGEVSAIADDELERLVKQGADHDDAAATLVLGMLQGEQSHRAEQVLRQWEADHRQPAQLAWVKGVYWQHAEAFDTARESFEEALSIEPDHDNARLGLAQALERLEDFEPAAAHFADHFRRWPHSEPSLLGLSRCSRRLGRVKLAAELMEKAIGNEHVSGSVWLEAAEVAFLQGEYGEAIRRFQQTDLDGPQLSITVRTAAIAYALAGRKGDAEALFDRYLAGHSLTFRRQTLESRVRADPSDAKAAEELQQILAGQYVPLAQQPKPPPVVSELFSLHCAACHGVSGEGDGPANRHLYPPSRNLRSDPYRLVTTENRFPSPDDIRAVIRNGIPGTSMPAFADLSDAEVEQLIEETYQLRQAGFRDDLMQDFEQLGQDLDEAAAQELVSRLGTAGQPLPSPPWPSIGPEQLAQGRTLFELAACDRCHGKDGSGQESMELFDHRGSPTMARDLAHDPMKGGDDRHALYARLRLGMPGTPHPANPTLSDEQLAFLVEYCLSIAKPKRPQTNYQRRVAGESPCPTSTEGTGSQLRFFGRNGRSRRRQWTGSVGDQITCGKKRTGDARLGGQLPFPHQPRAHIDEYPLGRPALFRWILGRLSHLWTLGCEEVVPSQRGRLGAQS